MFGTDDDDDFTPASGSKLASLFGRTPLDVGNTSLTYVAPKQPKKGNSESPVPANQSSAHPSKLSIIIAKAVHTYKLEEGSYNSQGKLGAAILGNSVSRIYQLLLYKNKQQHVTSTKISDKFQFTVQANKFASFYDDQRQNWSIMFDTEEDAVEFAKQICLVRANVQGEQGQQPVYVQDLKVGEGPPAEMGDMLEVRYTVLPLSGEGILGQVMESNVSAEKPHRVKVRKGVWEEALLGATKGCKKMIVLAPELFGPWKTQAPADARLAVEVVTGRIKSSRKSRDSTPSRSLLQADSSESNVDSGADESSIKARGASISEALTNSPKTHKASIISRMARMGQATLPLKGAVTCNPSDSEETEEECSRSSPAVGKSMAKTRSAMLKSRSTVHESVGPAPPPQDSTTASPSKQHLAVFQPVPTTPWQQPQSMPPQQILHNGVAYTIPSQYGSFSSVVSQPALPSHQMFVAPPTTPNTMSSPDTHLAMLLSENRAQNMEVRMGVAKVMDKVDQMMSKVDGMTQQRLPLAMGSLEPTALLSSIQKLVSDNEQLQAELNEKRTKLEQQNDKMYQLLHTNHKYLEQQEQQQQQQQHEPSLQSVVLTLQQEKAKLTDDLSEALSKATSFQSQASTLEKAGFELSEEVNKVTLRLQKQQMELEASKQTVLELEKSLQNLQEKLQAATQLNQSQESGSEELKSSVRDLQADRLKLEKSLMEANRQLELRNVLASEKLAALESRHKEELDRLNSELRKQPLSSNSDTQQEEKHLEEALTKQSRELTEKFGQLLEKMELEQTHLRSQVHELKSQLTAVNISTQPDHIVVVEDVKKVMNVMFRLLKAEFESGNSYDGADVLRTLLNTIKDVTLQYVQVKSTVDKQTSTKSVGKNQPSTMESINESPVADEKTINDRLGTNSPQGDEPSKANEITSEQLTMQSKHTAVDRRKSPDRSKSNSPVQHSASDIVPESRLSTVLSPEIAHGELSTQIKSEAETYQVMLPPVEKAKDVDVIESKAESESLPVARQSRESSLERGWRPQPPPPPLFDEEDDDDYWLS